MSSLLLRPRLIVFDCDACLWSPECFEIAPPLRKLDDVTVLAGRTTRVSLFPGAVQAFRDILQLPEFKETKIALASTTRYPEHSKILREFFCPIPGVSIASVACSSQIFYAYDKIGHFENIRKETGIPFSEMLFFDDCIWGDNVGDVVRQCPGVVGVRTPEGLTVEKWQEGLSIFAQRHF